ncbi:MAG: leucyl aminopeptidase [Sulfuricurvum sp.]|nr:leucyl aminopeptidase [Sulfuricurvum sp.]
MNVELYNQPLSSVVADITIEFVTSLQLETHAHTSILSMAKFEGKSEQVCLLHEHQLIVCGLDNESNDEYRLAMNCVIKTLLNTNYTSAKLCIPKEAYFHAVVEGVLLGAYKFQEYKSQPKVPSLQNIFFAYNSEYDFEHFQSILTQTRIISQATNFVRDLVNQTPYDMTPQAMAITADSLSKTNNLDCIILDVNGLEDEKMNAMLAVGRASINPPRLIHLAYKPQNPKKVITLVGKGLTYDSGGLSLKSAASMVTMKMDKAGGCAVMGIIKAISELKLDIEVHAFVGAVENMIGGNAYKPDDVLVAKNGKTIEVRNTDAEGRLVLADVLGYAQANVKADYIFDYATLTGACMVALGPYTTGVMGHNEELKQSWLKAADESGEYCGNLPFNPQLKKLIKSDLADVCNVSSKPYGGAITAALFLDNFINEDMKQKWVHFDIAGSAYTESAWDVHTYGGTGAGVRMTLQWLLKLQQQGNN